ncbi:MAG: PaaI family thioesterase [Burkholderiaceae bacterium]|jgi:uncharacterized protein (TIGR00369 family)
MIDPGIAQTVRDSFSSQGAMRALGATIATLDDGFCELRMPYAEAVAQQHGYFHGGVIAALGDSAGGYAANTKLMPERECLTAEYKINMLTPAQGEWLVARGRVVRPGRSLVVVVVDLFASQAGQERHCALMQMTLFAVTSRPLSGRAG